MQDSITFGHTWFTDDDDDVGDNHVAYDHDDDRGSDILDNEDVAAANVIMATLPLWTSHGHHRDNVIVIILSTSYKTHFLARYRARVKGAEMLWGFSHFSSQTQLNLCFGSWLNPKLPPFVLIPPQFLSPPSFITTNVFPTRERQQELSNNLLATSSKSFCHHQLHSNSATGALPPSDVCCHWCIGVLCTTAVPLSVVSWEIFFLTPSHATCCHSAAFSPTNSSEGEGVSCHEKCCLSSSRSPCMNRILEPFLWLAVLTTSCAGSQTTDKLSTTNTWMREKACFLLCLSSEVLSLAEVLQWRGVLASFSMTWRLHQL